LSWPEKDRPRIGSANRREHRLVTVLLDGSELGFAPVAHLPVPLGRITSNKERPYHSSYDAVAAVTQALPLTSSAPVAGGWQHHGILMARLDRTVTSLKWAGAALWS
jgi:hypothetical protein